MCVRRVVLHTSGSSVTCFWNGVRVKSADHKLRPTCTVSGLYSLLCLSLHVGPVCAIATVSGLCVLLRCVCWYNIYALSVSGLASTPVAPPTPSPCHSHSAPYRAHVAMNTQLHALSPHLHSPTSTSTPTVLSPSVSVGTLHSYLLELWCKIFISELLLELWVVYKGSESIALVPVACV